MNIFLWIILIFVMYMALISSVVFFDWYNAKMQKKADDEIGDLLKEKYKEEIDEEKQKHLMDEGFENIMSYEVNGKNGFEN